MILTPASTSGTNTAGQRTDSGGKRVLLLDLGGVLGLTSTGTLATSGVERSSSSALFIIDDIILTLILDSKSRAAAKSTAARFIEDLEHSQNQRVGHSETLSWPGRYPFIVYQSQANFLKFIVTKHVSFI